MLHSFNEVKLIVASAMAATVERLNSTNQEFQGTFYFCLTVCSMSSPVQRWMPVTVTLLPICPDRSPEK
jgi:hypothetical protein